MNRLKSLFEGKTDSLLSIYFTAGFPQLHSTLKIAEALEKAGADFLEIGFPYSDPLADGPAIQNSSHIALENGMNLKLLFEQLSELRSRVSLPVLLMGYFNPMLQFGVENFCKACKHAGIDGLIIPDLPMDEYEELYEPIFNANGLSNIFLITPQTSEDRIRRIDSLSNAFIYMVSTSATTGGDSSISQESEAYFSKVKAMELRNPTMIGFGISDKESFQKASMFARGAIVGSAFIRFLKSEDYIGRIPEFVQNIR